MFRPDQIDALSRAFKAALLSSVAPIEPEPEPGPELEPEPKSKPKLVNKPTVPEGRLDGSVEEQDFRPAAPATGPPSIDASRLPDYAVVSREHAAALLSVSVDTLKRLARRGEGPRRIRIGPKLIGYRLADLRAWIEQRPIV
jgi:predicted DNA-binding transcriptional regulator AlpA